MTGTLPQAHDTLARGSAALLAHLSPEVEAERARIFDNQMAELAAARADLRAALGMEGDA